MQARYMRVKVMATMYFQATSKKSQTSVRSARLLETLDGDGVYDCHVMLHLGTCRVHRDLQTDREGEAVIQQLVNLCLERGKEELTIRPTCFSGLASHLRSRRVRSREATGTEVHRAQRGS